MKVEFYRNNKYYPCQLVLTRKLGVDGTQTFAFNGFSWFSVIKDALRAIRDGKFRNV